MFGQWLRPIRLPRVPGRVLRACAFRGSKLQKSCVMGDKHATSSRAATFRSSCTSARYVIQLDSCAYNHHWCNGNICRCCSLRLTKTNANAVVRGYKLRYMSEQGMKSVATNAARRPRTNDCLRAGSGGANYGLSFFLEIWGGWDTVRHILAMSGSQPCGRQQVSAHYGLVAHCKFDSDQIIGKRVEMLLTLFVMLCHIVLRWVCCQFRLLCKAYEVRDPLRISIMGWMPIWDEKKLVFVEEYKRNWADFERIAFQIHISVLFSFRESRHTARHSPHSVVAVRYRLPDLKR